MLELIRTPIDQRRNNVRVEIPRLPGELWSVDPGASALHSGVLLNLSASGALIAMSRGVAVGSAVQCRFRLPNGTFFSLTAAVVREELQSALRRGAWVGVQFNIDGPQSDRLTQWIFTELARQRRASVDVNLGR